MKRLLVFLLLCLPLMGQGIISVSGRREPVGGCSTSISDDFSGTLSKWKYNSGSGWGIVSGQLETNNTSASLIYNDEATCTVTQWAEVEEDHAGPYGGFYFRSTDNSSEYAYALRRQSNGRLMWRYCTGHSCTDIESTGAGTTWAGGECIGMRVSGTGTSTTVEIWNHGATCSGTDPSSWGTADATLTNDPGQEANTGTYIGLYYGASTIDLRFDNFAGGSE